MPFAPQAPAFKNINLPEELSVLRPQPLQMADPTDLLGMMDEAAVDETVDETLDSVTQGFGSPDMKQALNTGAAATASTPATPATPAPYSSAPPSPVDYNAFIRDTLLWTNPVRSAVYLVCGTVLIMLVDYMLGHNVPLLTVVAYLTIAQMALNFLRHAVSPEMQHKATWLDSAWTAAAVQQIGDGIKGLAEVHDKHLSASNPHKHLIIAMSLWMVSLLCKLVTPMALALWLFIAAFAIPKAYMLLKSRIDPVAKDVYGKAKAKWGAADHRIKAGVIMVLILALGCVSTIDLVIAAFVVFVFAHSQLPKEVEQFGKKVGPVLTPVGNTAAAVGGRVSSMLIGASNKFELTPTPIKAKKEQ
ncbi:hypothetical protein FOA52_005767 [Chlamydomonas sp. UWO 241]|nr:hypothetical protein FOA52_005767 [Chlamydomonas sp. UWO 241]